MSNRIKLCLIIAFVIVTALSNAGAALAQTTAFTYQGKLTDDGNPANGIYDLTFKLFDAATVGSGTQQGATLSLTNVEVTNGTFSVQLDFGACGSCFDGADRFLEISIKPAGGDTFTMLSPRQELTATPYAIKSLSAATADGLSVTCVSCVTSSQIGSVNGSAVSGAIPVASVPAGSTNYIQNTTQPTGGTFNISGNGIVGGTLSGTFVNSAIQYNLGGNRVLSNAGFNLYVGLNAGFANSGDRNTYVGAGAGFSSGSENTFVGSLAGQTLTTGSGNTLLGFFAHVGDGVNNATAIGRRSLVTQSNSLVLGSINGVGPGDADTRVGIGTPAPQFKLHIIDPSNTGLRVQTNSGGGTVASFGGLGNFQIDAPGVAGGRFTVKENGFIGIGTNAPNDHLDVNGFIRFFFLGSGGTVSLCQNNLSRISFCSSSRRYKTNIANLHSGLNLINRLRPVTFDWKENKSHDLGLVAEEVAQVEPLLVTHNDKGEIEGVKYDRINAVLINAIKEQQTQIESLEKENLDMRARLAALERLMLQPRHYQVKKINKVN